MQPTAEVHSPGAGLSQTAVRLLAGLEVGLIAGLPAIAWLLFHSWLRGEPWWAKLNVAGALFFGGSVYSMGLSHASLAGGALLIAGYALLGSCFGLVARTSGVARNLLLGLLLALTWQILCQQYLLRLVDSFAPAYFPPLSTLPAQLMFGIGLARFGARFQSLASALGHPAWVPVPAPAQIAAPPPASPDEVSSPESLEIAPQPQSNTADLQRTQETDC